jgi:hypothetical protein
LQADHAFQRHCEPEQSEGEAISFLGHCEERSDEAISLLFFFYEIATAALRQPRNDTHIRHCEPERSEGKAISFLGHCEERSDEAISLLFFFYEIATAASQPRNDTHVRHCEPTILSNVIASPNRVRAKQSLFVLP